MSASHVRRAPVVANVLVLVAIVAVVAWEPRAGGEGFWYFVGIGGGLSLVWVIVGSLVTSREPRNPIGWLVLAIGAAYTFWGLANVAGGALVIRDIDSAPGIAMSWLATVLIGSLVALPFLFLLFPTGHALSPRWRVVAWITGVGGVVGVAAAVLTPDPTLNPLADRGSSVPNPVAISALAEIGGAISFLGVGLVLAMGVLSVVSLVLRFRRSSGDERQQIRWLAFVGGAAAVLLVVQILVVIVGTAIGLDENLPIFELLFLLFVAVLAIGIPLATGVAILKYRLYDLDVVIKKTVQFGILFALFVALVIVLVAAIPTVLVGFGATDVIPSVVAALVLTVVFVWVRRPARRLADRIVYGTRATPYEVLSEFSERVGETYSAEDVLPRMAAVLGEGAGAEQATVWLRIGGALRPAAVWPAGSEDPLELPADAVEVVHQGEPLGALSVRMPANDPMNPAKEKLVRDLAAQAGLVLRNVRLIEELRDSRRRLVAAQDEERRRIERNIHDGAQQQLVALAVQHRLAAALVGRDDDRVRAILGDLQAATNEALEDLRDLARGIYPPLLADRGLGAALEAQARKAAVPTTIVVADGVGRYPQEVESAVYFCCLEAMNNVAKYADASLATLELASSNGSLEFTVRDDGRGFDVATAARGTGLQGMADRLDAIGGSLLIQSDVGRGTTLRGTVPAEGSS